MPPDDSTSTISTLSAISTDSESEGTYIRIFIMSGYLYLLKFCMLIASYPIN